MASGRALNGIGRERRRGSLLADSARLELMDCTMVQSLAASAAVKAREGDGAARAARLLEQAVLAREAARRRGELALLDQAETAAERAARTGAADSRLLAAARLQQALCALDRAQMFADADGWGRARTRLGEAEAALGCEPGRLGGPGLIRARLTATDALANGDRGAMLTAIARFDQGITSLEARIRVSGAGLPESAQARSERAELMIAMGVRLKENTLIDQASRDLAALSARLNPAYLPLSWARAETLRGAALRLTGESGGEARLLKDAADVCRGALNAVPVGHSPSDRGRAAHGLAMALQGWGEVTGDLSLFRSALLAFDRAMAELAASGLTLRPMVAHDRAACLARHAERSGDATLLSEAEAAFKAELAVRSAARDPVAWAVTQIALARIYEIRAELLGDTGERADASLALMEAREVFADAGMQSLSEITRAALQRLREAALRS